MAGDVLMGGLDGKEVASKAIMVLWSLWGERCNEIDEN